jgi:hypothetical protein
MIFRSGSRKVFVAVLSCLFLTANAQDKLYTTFDTTYTEVKIVEVNAADLRYKKYSNIDGPLYTIEKKSVLKVVYENGEVEEYGPGAAIQRQQSPHLMPGSRLYLSFVNTANERNVNGGDAVDMLRSYIEGKTNCVVVRSPEEADFALDLQVVKRIMADRKAKITIRHLLDDSVVYETKWARGTSNAFYAYSGSRHAIGILVKRYIVKKYPSISNGL